MNYFILITGLVIVLIAFLNNKNVKLRNNTMLKLDVIKNEKKKRVQIDLKEEGKHYSIPSVKSDAYVFRDKENVYLCDTENTLLTGREVRLHDADVSIKESRRSVPFIYLLIFIAGLTVFTGFTASGFKLRKYIECMNKLEISESILRDEEGYKDVYTVLVVEEAGEESQTSSIKLLSFNRRKRIVTEAELDMATVADIFDPRTRIRKDLADNELSDKLPIAVTRWITGTLEEAYDMGLTRTESADILRKTVEEKFKIPLKGVVVFKYSGQYEKVKKMIESKQEEKRIKALFSHSYSSLDKDTVKKFSDFIFMISTWNKTEFPVKGTEEDLRSILL